MLGGAQRLNLQSFAPEYGCFRMYTIVHEFLHAVGLYHMQSATERDEYVQIIWENIQPGLAYNFEKYDTNEISQFGVEYDYGSVMHYPPGAFSVNGEPTIVALKDTKGEIMGQQVRMSEKDIQRVNNMYCPKPQRPPIKSIPGLFSHISQKMDYLFRNMFNRS
jgi:Astacin (Peptidase family M12A)